MQNLPRLLLIATTLLLVFLPLSSLHSQEHTTFIPSLGDVPLMEGLTLVEDSETVLDLPEGRIVEIFASGSLSHDTISQFYKKTLPALGWEPAPTNDLYFRDNENLAITTFTSENLSTVRFTLSPLSPS